MKYWWYISLHYWAIFSCQISFMHTYIRSLIYICRFISYLQFGRNILNKILVLGKTFLSGWQMPGTAIHIYDLRISLGYSYRIIETFLFYFILFENPTCIFDMQLCNGGSFTFFMWTIVAWLRFSGHAESKCDRNLRVNRGYWLRLALESGIICRRYFMCEYLRIQITNFHWYILSSGSSSFLEGNGGGGERSHEFGVKLLNGWIETHRFMV